MDGLLTHRVTLQLLELFETRNDGRPRRPVTADAGAVDDAITAQGYAHTAQVKDTHTGDMAWQGEILSLRRAKRR